MTDIRDAGQEDAGRLAELARQTYTDAFGHSMTASDLAAHLDTHLTPQRFAQMLETDAILVAEDAGRLTGFVQFGAMKDSPDAELRRLYVRAEHQNGGLGTRLMQAALAHPILRNARQAVLDVWEYNTRARRFYERHGFQVTGTKHFEVASGAPTSRDFIMTRRRV